MAEGLGVAGTLNVVLAAAGHLFIWLACLAALGFLIHLSWHAFMFGWHGLP